MAENIHVKLPDGSVKDVPRGTSALDIAKGISPRLADAALAAQIRPLDTSTPKELPSTPRTVRN
jgi:threonyl-tRNA synthetase